MQTWNSSRDNAPYNARRALKEFAARGINMPDNVNSAVAILERVTTDRPVKPPTDALRKLIVDGADQTDIDAALLADLGHQRLFVEYQQAELDAARIVLRELRNSNDSLFPQLEKRAGGAIKTLETVAGLGDVDLAALVREGRHDDAAALVEVETVGQELKHLYELRNGYLVPGGYTAMVPDGIDCTEWRDPRPTKHHGRGNDTVVQAYVRGLRAGGQLWFPDMDEALSAAEPIAAIERHKAEKASQARREQYDDASMFAG